MSQLFLTRYPSSDEGTFGTLTVGYGESALRLTTLEEPWIENPFGPGGMRKSDVQHESCVPDGIYRLIPHNSPKHPGTYCLVNHALGVFAEPADAPALDRWGRVAILIHNGNTLEDISGCILVGRHREMRGAHYVVTESVAALNDLRAMLGTDTHQLTIMRA